MVIGKPIDGQVNKNLAVLNRGVTAGFQSAKGEQPLAFPWEGKVARRPDEVECSDNRVVKIIE